MDINDYRYDLPLGEFPRRGEHDFLHEWFDLTGSSRFQGVHFEAALPALIRFAKIRYAPGTPAGNSRNQEYAVNI
jgi:hypothetical protein